MRCDHLTPVIFRASGSKFRVMVRASAREIPHATASRHQRRKIAKRAACCLLCASDRGISKRPHSRQKRPKQTSDRLPPSARSQTAPAAHLCPDTLHTAHASPALDSSTTTPQISSRSSTTNRKIPALSRPSPTRSTTDSLTVLSFFTQPLANPNLHALHASTQPLNHPLNLSPRPALPCPSLLSLKSSSVIIIIINHPSLSLL